MRDMRILSRIFGRRKVIVDALDLIDREKGAYVCNREVPVKYRRAQNLPENLRRELIDVCRASDFVAVAYFLDVMEPATGEIRFFVTLTFDDATADLYRVAHPMRQILSRYPDYSKRFFIGGEPFGPLDLTLAAYIRDAT